MSVVEQFPYCDRNPASGGLDLMPDLPIILRHQSRSVSGVGLVDSGASISVLPYLLGVQLGFDWTTQTAHITLAGTLARVPLSGGSPREVLDQVRDAAWGPDGSLAVVHIVNGRDRLEYPIGKVLYETARKLLTPRAPD